MVARRFGCRAGLIHIVISCAAIRSGPAFARACLDVLFVIGNVDHFSGTPCLLDSDLLPFRNEL
jgi:hypothetical protein